MVLNVVVRKELVDLLELGGVGKVDRHPLEVLVQRNRVLRDFGHGLVRLDGAFSDLVLLCGVDKKGRRGQKAGEEES